MQHFVNRTSPLQARFRVPPPHSYIYATGEATSGHALRLQSRPGFTSRLFDRMERSARGSV